MADEINGQNLKEEKHKKDTKLAADFTQGKTWEPAEKQNSFCL